MVQPLHIVRVVLLVNQKPGILCRVIIGCTPPQVGVFQ